MNRSTAHALAGGGSLLCVLSLLTPWYVLEAAGLTGLGKTGAAALGSLAFIVVALAIAAGSSATTRVHPLLPPLSAAGLALVVVAKIAWPPSAASAFPGLNTGDALQSKLAASFLDTITTGLRLHYAPAWGIWLAAIGAGMALAGTITALRGVRRGSGRSW